jgi:hypothetical protein
MARVASRLHFTAFLCGIVIAVPVLLAPRFVCVKTEKENLFRIFSKNVGRYYLLRKKWQSPQRMSLC